jgi:HSP20 family molecular chaperone IbpA
MAERTAQNTHAQQQTGVEQTRGGAHFAPKVDIVEDSKELILYADMPGVAPGDVDLRYEKGELILHGRIKPRSRAGNPLLREYQEGDFYRVFHVHESIDSSKIEAVCKDGVLTIHLPKVEAAQPKKVKVRSE